VDANIGDNIGVLTGIKGRPNCSSRELRWHPTREADTFETHPRTSTYRLRLHDVRSYTSSEATLLGKGEGAEGCRIVSHLMPTPDGTPYANT